MNIPLPITPAEFIPFMTALAVQIVRQYMPFFVVFAAVTIFVLLLRWYMATHDI